VREDSELVDQTNFRKTMAVSRPDQECGGESNERKVANSCETPDTWGGLGIPVRILKETLGRPAFDPKNGLAVP